MSQRHIEEIKRIYEDAKQREQNDRRLSVKGIWRQYSSAMNKGQFSCKLVVMIIMFWSCLSCTHLGLPWGPPLHTPSCQCWSWSTVAFDAARIEDLWGVRDSSGIYSRNLSSLRLSSCVPFDAAFKHCVRQGNLTSDASGFAVSFHLGMMGLGLSAAYLDIVGCIC